MADIKYDIIATSSGEYRTTLNRTYRERKPWQPVDPNKIRSFMPGTVEQIDVAEGDKVKEGDRLLVFRAMKMSNNILSPATGKVKSIEVSVGENISKDHVMIEIEPSARARSKPKPMLRFEPDPEPDTEGPAEGEARNDDQSFFE